MLTGRGVVTARRCSAFEMSITPYSMQVQILMCSWFVQLSFVRIPLSSFAIFLT